MNLQRKGRNMPIRPAIKILSCLVVAFTTSTAQASGWKLVFEDNFKEQALDRSKWSTRYIYADETLDRLNDELEHYRDNNNHVVRDGQLELVARQTGAKQFESGMIRSIQTFYYGYFEARVFLPKGKGIAPAFWLNPDYDRDGGLNWPPEIDIFEYVVNGKEDTESMVHSTALVKNAAPVTFDYNDPRYSLRWKSYVNDTPLSDAWHVFGLVWSPDKISVFLDGKRIYTQSYKWVNNSGALAAPAHVLMNFAVGGQWAGRHGIDEGNFPQALKVDYIRVCQFEKRESGQKRCGDSEFTPSPADFGYDAPFNDLAKPTFRNAKLSIEGAGQNRADVGIRPGAQLLVENHIEWPDDTPDRHLKLSLNRLGDSNILKSADYSVALSTAERNKPSPIRYAVPSDTPPGDYYVVASLLASGAAQDRAAGLKQTPLRCDTDLDKRIKSLSCNIARIRVEK
jgi:beta-glucanase (GH16 family)